jgi:hypothetical protein
VETKKNVLIVTDGAASTMKAAEQIAAELPVSHVVIRAASEFAGTDILPAEVFFLGCEAPNPPSFAYLEEMLRHINLVGRRCGIFSPKSEKAAAYLVGIVKDCEASVGEPFVFPEDGAGLKKWVKSIR